MYKKDLVTRIMLDSPKSLTAASQSIPLATLFDEKKRVAILAFSQAYTYCLGFEERVLILT